MMTETHRLIILIGKGQRNLVEDKNFTYRKADYFLKENPTGEVTTPFVGEAIVRLCKEQNFTDVHVLGTKDSMWSTLYAHIHDDEFDESQWEVFERIENARSKSVPLEDSLLQEISTDFSNRNNIAAHFHIVPVGKSDQEVWDFFKVVSDLVQDKDKISIDITHSLRYQPFILVLAMAYVRALKFKVKWGKTYYGALELTDQYFKGKTPIMDLTPMFSMLEWIYAVQAFRVYGDTAGITEILGTIPEADKFVKRAQDLTHSVQFFELEKIRKYASGFMTQLGTLEKTQGENHPPLALVAEPLREFPLAMFNAKTEWKLLLELASRQFQIQGQKSLAIVTLWEAIICRFAEIYGVDRKRMENYKGLGVIIRNRSKWRRLTLPDMLMEIPVHGKKLNKFRNTLAHRSTKPREVKEMVEKFPQIFYFFQKCLHYKELDTLRNQIPFSAKR